MGNKPTEFGKLCRNCRTNKGLNMIRAAELTGKSQATLTNYETGKESPSFGFIKTSMDVYGIKEQTEQMRFLFAALKNSEKIEIPLSKFGPLAKEYLAALCILGDLKANTPKGWDEFIKWLEDFAIKLKKTKPKWSNTSLPERSV
jgi:transcriptional regulator with XRE-family HTH domain